MNSELVVTLNDLAINDGASGFFLDDQIDGVSLPEIRTSSGNLSGRDGGYVGNQFFSGRVIGVNGRAYSSDIATVEDRRKTLQETLATKSVTLRITTYAGHSWVIACYVLRADMPIKDNLNFADFQIQLYAPDPIIYDDTAGGALSATVEKAVASGFSWPITWPIDWGTSTGPTTVTNSGSVTVFPTITLTDIMTDPIITNQTTGQVLSFTGLTTSDGDEVVLDMKNHTATLNGGSILDKVDTDSQWWGLAPGANTIVLESSSGGDTVTATIEWRSGVMGI